MALIHRWPLIADMNDVVGDWHLTKGGAGTPTYHPIKGMNFTGTILGYKLSPTLPSGAFSMSIWVDVTGAGGCFLYYAGKYSYNGNYTGLSNTSLFQVGGGNYINRGDWDAENFPPGTQKLIVCTWDGTTAKYYRNSSTVTVQGTPGTGTRDNYAICIGGAWVDGGGTEYYSGWGADPRLFDHALTAGEVATLLSDGPNPDYRPSSSGESGKRLLVPTPLIGRKNRQNRMR